MSTAALITGASRGIGRATAAALAAAGHPVALLARSGDELRKLEAALASAGGKAKAIVCDLADRASIARAVDQAESTLGELGVLVNNAGLGGPFHRADQVSATEWRHIFATNVESMAELGRLLLPKMKAQGYGRVINISSVQGLFGGAGSSTYAASKHAMIGYTRSIAVEWGQHGITCNAICPGYIDTDLLAGNPDEEMKRKLKARIPVARFGTAEEVAGLVVYLCSASSGYVNGSALVMDGGLSAHLG